MLSGAMDWVKKYALRVARWRVGGYILSYLIQHADFLLPTERLYESENLLAFYHPQPSYAVHIVLVPKRPIRQMIDVGETDGPFLQDLFAAVRFLVAHLGLERYRLICNGGDYQDVALLHFHLIVETPHGLKETPASK